MELKSQRSISFHLRYSYFIEDWTFKFRRTSKRTPNKWIFLVLMVLREEHSNIPWASSAQFFSYTILHIAWLSERKIVFVHQLQSSQQLNKYNRKPEKMFLIFLAIWCKELLHLLKIQMILTGIKTWQSSALEEAHRFTDEVPLFKCLWLMLVKITTAEYFF